MSTPKSTSPHNPHARWLRELAAQLEQKKDTVGARTCSRAADEIDALILRLYPGSIDQIERYRSILLRICLRTTRKDERGIRALCREAFAPVVTDGQAPEFLFDPGTEIQIQDNGGHTHRARYLCPALEGSQRHVVVLSSGRPTKPDRVLTAAAQSIALLPPRSRGSRAKRGTPAAASRK